MKYPQQEMYPDEPFGKFIVYKSDHEIKMNEYDLDEDYAEGQMLWLHDPDEKPDQ